MDHIVINIDYWQKIAAFAMAFAGIIGFISSIAWAILKGRFAEKKEIEGVVDLDQLERHCVIKQAGCKHEHPDLCNTLHQIRLEISVMDQKREEARKEQTTQLEKISFFMGEVSQFMKKSGA